MATSVIAQVDSSVGGKVGIDLESGKNQAGSFYQPKAVIIDPDLLRTLPDRCRRDGMGEVIKYGCICDGELFEILEKNSFDTLAWEDIIFRCVQAKADIVAGDVFDKGERMLLNFGHTFGHAVEKYYEFKHYMHGEAVAIGMVRITAGTEARGLTDAGTTGRLKKLLKKYGLPVETQAADKDVLPYVRRDKKRRSGRVTLAIITRIGQGKLLSADLSDIEMYLQRGLYDEFSADTE